MTSKLKWAAIVVGVSAVLIVAWWIFGKLGVIAGIGGLGALFGLRRERSVGDAEQESVIDALDDGIAAKESASEHERTERKRHAADALSDASKDVEERANATVDPDSAPWRRRGRNS